MKLTLSFLILFSVCIHSYGQTPIHDRAIVAQQERMVFKQWDEDKFYPEPKRLLGIPTNPIWYILMGLASQLPGSGQKAFISERRTDSKAGVGGSHADLIQLLQAALRYGQKLGSS